MKKNTRKALIIVDIQNDFLPPEGALAIKEGDAIIPIINFLQNYFDLVVATKDWHPPHHCSFALEQGRRPGEIIEIQGKRQELWPVHCVQGSKGAEFSPLLDVSKLAKIFYKGADPEIDSYSAFFDNAHLRSTGLGEYLKERGIQEIIITGLATEYCVKYSVHDALTLGFSVSVVSDGCRGIDLKPGDVEKAWKEMEKAGAFILSSKQLIAQIE